MLFQCRSYCPEIFNIAIFLRSKSHFSDDNLILNQFNDSFEQALETSNFLETYVSPENAAQRENGVV